MAVSGAVIEIPRIAAWELGARRFREEHHRPRRPVVLVGAGRWSGADTVGSLPALASRYGDRRVATRVFDAVQRRGCLRFCSLQKRIEEQPLARFITQTALREPEPEAAGIREAHYLRIGERDDTLPGLPGLLEGLQLPPLFTHEGTGVSDFSAQDTCLRIGPPSYEYPAHCDNTDNLLLQLAGRKELALFEPSCIASMYPDPEDLARSRVDDIDRPDRERFPAFAGLTRHVAAIEAGDAVYIPALWFHNVRSIGPGISVSRHYRRADHRGYVHALKPAAWHAFEGRIGRRVY